MSFRDVGEGASWRGVVEVTSGVWLWLLLKMPIVDLIINHSMSVLPLIRSFKYLMRCS